ncbi:MAG: dephospho-CoA kinase [Pseudomonadota bacterium]
MSNFIVGVTGGIGSGKTAVTDRFQAHGISVVDADLASRAVVEAGRPALKAIAERHGSSILTADGALDRRALRAIVFDDPDERHWLEALTHPLIAAEIDQGLAQATSPYVVLAHPLLVESGTHRRCNRVLVVDVPVDVQIERTMSRDGSDRSQVEAIIAVQASRETRLGVADDVIVNDRDLSALDDAVAALHEDYLRRAKAEAS